MLKGTRIEFGFLPKHINVRVGDVEIRPFDNIDAIISDFFQEAKSGIYQDWIYPSSKVLKIIGKGEYYLPFPSRVFGMPKTHSISHSIQNDTKRIEFHVWVLSFFLGIRLSCSEAGFLDSTPVKVGKLNDFIIRDRDIGSIIDLSENYWQSSAKNPEKIKSVIAIIHALFVGQNPQGLEYERFIHLYMALDGCYNLKKIDDKTLVGKPHSQRISAMCVNAGIPIPSWADRSLDGKKGTIISELRNEAVHDAMLLDEPLGYKLFGSESINLTLQMQALICRLLFKSIGGKDRSYIESGIDTRQIYSIDKI